MEPNQFKLTIALGNDAMQSSYDIADALRATADKIENIYTIHSGSTGKVIDANGNTVGQWEAE
jgi:hypothetical protein